MPTARLVVNTKKRVGVVNVKKKTLNAMNHTEEINLYLSAYELDILIESIDIIKQQRADAGDALRFVRLERISGQLKDRATTLYGNEE